ncbi:MAG: ABC transporter permease [Actinobacteria bacterium]|nr:ABC transporter permease [Actinomycetota bacterium]
MSRLPVFAQDLREGRRSLIGWALGLIVVMMIYLPFFELMGGSDEIRDMLDMLPPALVETVGYDQMFTGPGYAQATILGLLGFILGTIAAVGWGARAIAGDEETGTLELTLAHRVSRERLVLERALGILVRLLVLGVVVAVVLVATSGPFGLDLVAGNVLAAVTAFVILLLTTAMAALAAGAVVGRRVVALAAGTGLAVFGYVGDAVGGQAAGWGWLQDISPFAWAYGGDPITDGWDLGGLALLLALSAVLLGAAVLAFRRRDVGT